MQRISSKWTFFYKRVFPVIWFGFILLFIGVNLTVSPPTGPTWIFPLLIVPIALGGFGYYFMRKFVFDLADEVYDDGDALVVRNGGQEQRIALADIKNVNYSALVSPPRVTLSLRRPTVFGEEVSFCAPVRVVPFATSPVINELIERVDRAREQSHPRR
jgi:hypothetical protein